MKIYKNIISDDFLITVNKYIDERPYNESVVFFDNEKSKIHNYIKKELSKNILFNKICEESYIVIRCVKDNDKKMRYYPHYDNYLDTYVIPLLIPEISPRGELHYLENARKIPKNIFISTITKFIVQNFLARLIIKNYLGHLFLTLNVSPGDVVHFNGLTTLHYNKTVSSERRSILIHINNPFKNTLLNKLIEHFGRLNVKRY
jgi:hypothetical protein